MEIINEKIDMASNNKIRSDMALFDIETTGLSPLNSYICIIGAVSYSDNTLILTQWLSNSPDDEINMLKSFYEFIKEHPKTIHYNGLTFDIPFVNERFKKNKIDFSIDKENSIDVYRKILPLKKYLTVKNFKQSTIEKLTGYERTDTITGEELIGLYAKYVGTLKLAAYTNNHFDSEELKKAILLHNHDDLIGLSHIYLNDRTDEINEFSPNISIIGNTLSIEYNVNLLPFGMNVSACPFSFSFENGRSCFQIDLINNELKYFFKNYKDYSYIFSEDSAVHNSIADFMVGTKKKKCTPQTAYIKKTGVFLPIPVSSSNKNCNYETILNKKIFFDSFNDKIGYVEYDNNLFSNKSFLNTYVDLLLKFIV